MAMLQWHSGKVEIKVCEMKNKLIKVWGYQLSDGQKKVKDETLRKKVEIKKVMNAILGQWKEVI